MSLAEVLAKPKVLAHNTPLKTVQLDGQVVLKIAQHCNEALPNLVTGQLLGLDVGQTLEVTDCFAFPAQVTEEDNEEDGASYQLDMMRCLREVNVDNNTVGWYQSATLGSFQTVELIETFVNYHENIKKCVCLIYDPQRSARGGLALKAVRLKDNFIELFKEQKLTGKDFREANIAWKDVFQEIPIKINNSPLIQALVSQLEPDHDSATQGDFDRLNLSMAPFLEKNMEMLIDRVDDLVAEQSKVSMYHKQLARQAQQMAAWVQKRRLENQARRAAGEELLPEEDPVLFKPLPEPSLLDNYLVSCQMSTFCDQINVASTNALQKLYIFESFAKGSSSQ